MDISKRYAIELMCDYMFNGRKNHRNTIETMATKLVFEFPAHDFVIDYEIASNLRLAVELIEGDLLELSQGIIDKVGKQHYTFIRLYDLR